VGPKTPALALRNWETLSSTAQQALLVRIGAGVGWEVRFVHSLPGLLLLFFFGSTGV
jgi:hypothetical protein